MSRVLQGAPLLRCLIVWSAAATASLTLLVLAVGEVATASTASFETIVVGGCAVVLAGCAGWFWVVATIVVAGAVRGAERSVPGCPRWLIRALLAGCGLALLVPASAAQAESDPAPGSLDLLAGLPLPDRAELQGPVAGAATGPTVVVSPGDSLWALAQRSLPADAEPGDIDRRWRAIWAANRSVIGADPDLIHPGVTLRLPRKES